MKFLNYLKSKNISINQISKDSGIPYSTLYNQIVNPSKMILKNMAFLSEYLEVDLDTLFTMLYEEEVLSLLAILKDQRDSKLKGNIYHNTQIEFSYNTNRIEGSKLSIKQTREIFETRIISDNKHLNVDDIIETSNSFLLFDFMLDTAHERLSERLIKQYHKILKQGTLDSMKSWFNLGEYKLLPNEVGGNETSLTKYVSSDMKNLIRRYHTKEEIKLKDIIDFHFRFEKIHPFQDGNGRVGRMIMFKECLKHNIVPFILLNDYKNYYYRGLNEFSTDPNFLKDTFLSMQDKYRETIKKYLEPLYDLKNLL